MSRGRSAGTAAAFTGLNVTSAVGHSGRPVGDAPAIKARKVVITPAGKHLCAPIRNPFAVQAGVVAGAAAGTRLRAVLAPLRHCGVLGTANALRV